MYANNISYDRLCVKCKDGGEGYLFDLIRIKLKLQLQVTITPTTTTPTSEMSLIQCMQPMW